MRGAAVCAVLALGGVGGAGCTPEPPPRLAAAVAPRIVARPPSAPCTLDTLEEAAPWSGKILERQKLATLDEEVPYAPVVRTDWVLCGEMDERDCAAWAESIAADRAKTSGLEFEVTPGRSHRGKVWLLRVDGREESHLFATNRDFVTFFRALGAQVDGLEIVSSDRVVEARHARVEITYRDASPGTPRPAQRWRFEMGASSQPAAEAILAFEDLSARGIELSSDSWQELLDKAREVSALTYGEPSIANVRGQQPEKSVQLWLEARCAGD